ncbi:hypothetical protein AAFX60_005655 [Aliivibrio fischeri]
MRVVEKPIHAVRDVYQLCVNSISDNNTRVRLNDISNIIEDCALEYEQKARVSNLYLVPPNYSDNNSIIVGEVTKKELKSIYSQHMVAATKPARRIYDELMNLAPNGRCPFCGLGHVSTLDHYLPKSKYPFYSVLPINLVPSCKDCNTGKGAALATCAGEQPLHPYYDHQHYITEQWIFAEVIETIPLSVRFFVRPPEEWDPIFKSRVQCHFTDYNLSSRFAVEVADELSSLKYLLTEYISAAGVDAVKNYLIGKASAEANNHINSWLTALYQALAESNWYCQGGYAFE